MIALLHRVQRSKGQTCDFDKLIMLELDALTTGQRADFTAGVIVGALKRIAIDLFQNHSKCKFLRLVSTGAGDCLLNPQTAGRWVFRRIGVGDRNGFPSAGRDCDTPLTRHTYGVILDVNAVPLFHNLILTGNQAGEGLAAISGNTDSLGVAVWSCNSKCKDLGLCLAGLKHAAEVLFDSQTANHRLLSAVDELSSLSLIFPDGSRDDAVGRNHIPNAALRPRQRLLYRKPCSHGQALNGNALIMVQKKCFTAGNISRLVAAIEVVSAGQSLAIGILQGNQKLEAPGIVRRIAASCDHLTNQQIPGILSRALLPVGHHHDIQQAEQAGEIQLSQIIPVGIRVVALIRAARPAAGVVLLHPGADEAGVSDKEGVKIFPAVLVVKAIVHHRVPLIVQIHGA